MRSSILLLSLLSLNGCDYWPPALHNEIERLRAQLNDALDDRQRFEMENSDLRLQQEVLQREVESKARENIQLQRHLAESDNKVGKAPAAKSVGQIQKGSGLLSRPREGSVSRQADHAQMKRPRVVELQQLLRRHGLPIRVDGIYGRNTAAATRSFQRSNGLPADGIVGPATYSALHRPSVTSKHVRQLWLQRPLLKGGDVLKVQRALRRAGYRIPIDGQFGPVTATAITRFQRKRGIEPDGIVGPRTWAALSSAR